MIANMEAERRREQDRLLLRESQLQEELSEARKKFEAQVAGHVAMRAGWTCLEEGRGG